ncbi:MAG: FeoB-associated Cys-rich membrane protein [Oscillospiraceae bacterium]|nr:FeoB-associated Cys-rich membrane protein [Oscillospiraceae bacterium]
MSIPDILLLIVIAAAVALAIRKIYRDRKQGKSCMSCGGNCSVCSQGCVRSEKDTAS